MRVGVLTGGGDCPGLNAVIRAVVRKGEVEHGDTFVGFREGWKGVTENLTRPLNVEHCRGILPKGGTILGTSRTNPYKIEGGVEAVRETLGKHGHRRSGRLGTYSSPPFPPTGNARDPAADPDRPLPDREQAGSGVVRRSALVTLEGVQ